MFGAECRAFGRLCICAPRARVSLEISRFTRRRAADDGINGMMVAAYCSYIARDQPAAQTWDAFRETCDLRALQFLSPCSNFMTGRECANIVFHNKVCKKTMLRSMKHKVQVMQRRKKKVFRQMKRHIVFFYQAATAMDIQSCARSDWNLR